MLLILGICFCVVWRCTDLPKIVAPRMRAVQEKDDPLDDFIVKEDTPIEDFDPELKLNPVILAKLEVERMRRFKKNRKPGGPVWRGGPGALARLGITLAKEEGKKAEPKKLNMKNIDVMLQKENKDELAGTPNSGAQAKEITRRALTMHSKAKEKKTKQFAADRMPPTLIQGLERSVSCVDGLTHSQG